MFYPEQIEQRDVRIKSLESQLATQAQALKEAESTNQRLADLVRYQRHELHTADLISNEEYAEIVQNPGAVNRLEGYDVIRAKLKEAEEKIDSFSESFGLNDLEQVRQLFDGLSANYDKVRAERDSLRSQLDQYSDSFEQLNVNSLAELVDRYDRQLEAVTAERDLAQALNVTVDEMCLERMDAVARVEHFYVERWRKTRKAVERLTSHEGAFVSGFLIFKDEALAVIDSVLNKC